MKTIKTGIATLMLLLAISCKKENIIIQSSAKMDESAAQDLATDFTGLGTEAIKIGTQVWKKKDLITSYYRNGDKIPQVKDPAKWAKLTTGAWCWYNGDPRNGKLYNWYAVNDPRGLAPTGWHIPADAEWDSLTAYLGGFTVAGGKMKETGTTHWLAPNADATNSSGFTALPGGARYDFGDFGERGSAVYWWSSSESGSLSGSCRYLTYFYGTLSSSADYKPTGFSVRCIKD
ncbi:MAG: fibrobacter succinogenes major paralogous domain-containing protein [Panacibacter sp.]